MAASIAYSREAARALQRMDRATSRRIMAKIALLATDPAALANNIKPLKGGAGLMRLRVGDWRVIYTEDGTILDVIRIAPRGAVYE